jgi:RNA polymerase sigma factor (sigma-70 family)
MANLPDGQLLDRFTQQRDEAAFAALLQRHGPLVLGVCRRLLGDVHDADDAFQATFLVLACRAAAIRRGEALASFLYGTACRVARRLRGQKARRQALHQQAAHQRPEASAPSADDGETHALLHEELERLPRKYRDVLILCYLQGKTNEQAAHELGCPLGSMSRRLGRARELLRDRLLSRGAGVLAALVGPALAEQATAAVPAALAWSTVETVRRHGIATALLASATPPIAVVLARGVLHAARLTRLTIATTLLAAGLAVAGGATALRFPTEKQPQPEAKTPAPPAGNTAQAKAPPRFDLYDDPLPEGVLARMGTERLRHPLALRLVFAADGKTLISAGQDQTVRFWDLATGKLKRLQRAPQSQLVMAISSDGKTLALTSEEHLHLWDIAAAKEIQRIATGKLDGNNRLLWVEFSPDGKTLAASKADSTVLIWEAAAGKERTRFKHKDRRVHNLAFSSDGKILAATGDQHVLLWDLATGTELHSIESRHGPYAKLSFSPDGKLLADALFSSVVLWDVAAGKKSDELAFFAADKKPATGHEVAFAPDGKTVAVYCNENDFVVLWDRSTRKEVKRLTAYRSHTWYPLGWLGFSPDGKLLASLHSGKITLWDVASGKQLQERASHFAATDSVAISPDGKFVASAAGGDRTVRLWDAHSGKPLHVWPMPHGRIDPLLFTPDGASVLAAGLWGECRMWNVRTGEERQVFRVPDFSKNASEQIPAAHLSPDGKRLTAVSLWGEIKDGVHKRQRYLTTWDVASGERIHRRRLSFDSRIILSLEEMSPDGRFATIFDARGLIVYDVAADRPLRTFAGDSGGPVAFSPDSKLLAFAGSHSRVPKMERVRLCDLATGADVLTLAAGRVSERAFSPDGRYLLTVGDDGLRLWELATGKEVLRRQTVEQPGHPPVSPEMSGCLAFASDGRSVATGLPDTNLVIWDLAPTTRQKHKLGADDLARLWSDLAGDDAPRAYQAAGTLIADPERSVPFLRDRLHAVKEDTPRIRKLIVDLNSEQFAVRDAARKELEKMDDAAHAVLRQALKEATSLEQRRRLEALLSVGWVVRSPEKLRQIRAVMVLEQIGDAEARRVLERLAAGAAEARQTREAKAALERLTKRP